VFSNWLEGKLLATQSLTRPRLVIFDVEGVLIPKNRFFFEVGKSLGFKHLMKVLLFGFLYEIGAIPLKSALKPLFSNLRGVKIEELMDLAAKIPIVSNANEVFEQLRTQGCKTALISSGLPTILVQQLATKLNADYAFGFEVGIDGGTLTGDIWGDVIERNGKLRVLSRIIKTECLSTSDCVVVADDRNNASIFLRDIHKIGYNPDFVLRIKADNVVNGKISKIVAVINGEPKHRGPPSINDIFREGIHASGFLVPVVAGLIGVPIVAVLIFIVLGLYGISEALRTEGKRMPIIYQITLKAASQAELYQLVLAPAYFAIGILLTLILFPFPASSAAIAMFAFGDSAASIFGRYFSKTPLPFNKDKSLEGSMAGFFFAFLAGLFFISPLKALVGAAVAMIVEYLPLPVNDNILIPLITGLTLTAMA
jgi:dolichol kinase/phosphoserine phosphatase